MFVGRNSDRYGLQGPGQSEVFRIRPNRPSGKLSIMYSRYRVSFRGVKRLGCGVDHPPPCSAEIKKKAWSYIP